MSQKKHKPKLSVCSKKCLDEWFCLVYNGTQDLLIYHNSRDKQNVKAKNYISSCNQQVGGSSPLASSKVDIIRLSSILLGSLIFFDQLTAQPIER